MRPRILLPLLIFSMVCPVAAEEPPANQDAAGNKLPTLREVINDQLAPEEALSGLTPEQRAAAPEDIAAAAQARADDANDANIGPVLSLLFGNFSPDITILGGTNSDLVRIGADNNLTVDQLVVIAQDSNRRFAFEFIPAMEDVFDSFTRNFGEENGSEVKASVIGGVADQLLGNLPPDQKFAEVFRAVEQINNLGTEPGAEPAPPSVDDFFRLTKRIFELEGRRINPDADPVDRETARELERVLGEKADVLALLAAAARQARFEGREADAEKIDQQRLAAAEQFDRRLQPLQEDLRRDQQQRAEVAEIIETAEPPLDESFQKFGELDAEHARLQHVLNLVEFIDGVLKGVPAEFVADEGFKEALLAQIVKFIPVGKLGLNREQLLDIVRDPNRLQRAQGALANAVRDRIEGLDEVIDFARKNAVGPQTGVAVQLVEFINRAAAKIVDDVEGAVAGQKAEVAAHLANKVVPATQALKPGNTSSLREIVSELSGDGADAAGIAEHEGELTGLLERANDRGGLEKLPLFEKLELFQTILDLQRGRPLKTLEIILLVNLLRDETLLKLLVEEGEIATLAKGDELAQFFNILLGREQRAVARERAPAVADFNPFEVERNAIQQQTDAAQIAKAEEFVRKIEPATADDLVKDTAKQIAEALQELDRLQQNIEFKQREETLAEREFRGFTDDEVLALVVGLNFTGTGSHKLVLVEIDRRGLSRDKIPTPESKGFLDTLKRALDKLDRGITGADNVAAAPAQNQPAVEPFNPFAIGIDQQQQETPDGGFQQQIQDDVDLFQEQNQRAIQGNQLAGEPELMVGAGDQGVAAVLNGNSLNATQSQILGNGSSNLNGGNNVGAGGASTSPPPTNSPPSPPIPPVLPPPPPVLPPAPPAITTLTLTGTNVFVESFGNNAAQNTTDDSIRAEFDALKNQVQFGFFFEAPLNVTTNNPDLAGTVFQPDLTRIGTSSFSPQTHIICESVLGASTGIFESNFTTATRTGNVVQIPGRQASVTLEAQLATPPAVNVRARIDLGGVSFTDASGFPISPCFIQGQFIHPIP